MIKQNIEIRLLSIIRKTLVAVAKDTMTKPGLKHPLNKETITMITDCFDLIALRQQEIEQDVGNSSVMRPKFADEQTTKTFSVNDLKNTIK